MPQRSRYTYGRLNIDIVHFISVISFCVYRQTLMDYYKDVEGFFKSMYRVYTSRYDKDTQNGGRRESDYSVLKMVARNGIYSFEITDFRSVSLAGYRCAITCQRKWHLRAVFLEAAKPNLGSWQHAIAHVYIYIKRKRKNKREGCSILSKSRGKEKRLILFIHCFILLLLLFFFFSLILASFRVIRAKAIHVFYSFHNEWRDGYRSHFVEAWRIVIDEDVHSHVFGSSFLLVKISIDAPPPPPKPICIYEF